MFSLDMLPIHPFKGAIMLVLFMPLTAGWKIWVGFNNVQMSTTGLSPDPAHWVHLGTTHLGLGLILSQWGLF